MLLKVYDASYLPLSNTCIVKPERKSERAKKMCLTQLFILFFFPHFIHVYIFTVRGMNQLSNHSFHLSHCTDEWILPKTIDRHKQIK